MLNLVIDTKILSDNLDYITHKLDGTPMCAVVKAEAYGHGFEIVKFIEAHCSSFAVANGKEAEILRRYTHKPIYVLGGFDPYCFNDEFIYTVSSFKQIQRATECGVKQVALKLNTGMNRLGFSLSEAQTAMEQLVSKRVKIDSVYTHLFDPTTENAVKQKLLFEEFKARGIKRHCAASNFLTLGKNYEFDMVRCGLAIYGYGYTGVKPIAKAYSEVVDIHTLKCGDYIGYGRTQAERDMTVATISAGYADGINRRNTGKNIEINGCLCPRVGNICMDMCMADVSGVDVSERDRAYFISEVSDAEDLAENCGTIVYEILTSFRGRVRREYL